ncbi:hypothetical protein F5Y07DRAFT_24119 [Xylaria sp. FL0933]|nr:hypothetical protein F5Y07DRAFT_24119 [Xylaria sp. FL0933]
MSIYSQHPTSIDAPAPVAASARSSKTAVVVVDESEVPPDHYQYHNEQNAWAEWERRRHDHHNHHQHNHHSHRNHHTYHQQTSSSSAYYHLFPASPSPRDRPLTASSYFPTAQHHHQQHHRPASEEEEYTPRRLPRFSCGAASLLVRGGGSPSRMAHVKGTVCVVLAIALIFIVVLVLALVSNNKDHS